MKQSRKHKEKHQAQAQQLKRDSQENKLTRESVFELLSNEKANQKV